MEAGALRQIKTIGKEEEGSEGVLTKQIHTLNFSAEIVNNFSFIVYLFTIELEVIYEYFKTFAIIV